MPIRHCRVAASAAFVSGSLSNSRRVFSGASFEGGSSRPPRFFRQAYGRYLQKPIASQSRKRLEQEHQGKIYDRDAGCSFEDALAGDFLLIVIRGLLLRATHASEVFRTLNRNLQEHFRVLRAAVLSAWAEKDARLVRVHPHFIVRFGIRSVFLAS